MSENNTTVTTPESTAQQETERTFTQTELNAILKDRLEREKSKYADYEELKSKATAYDEAQEASKSELQKANELAEKYRAELDDLKKAADVREIREKVAKETGVPASMLTYDTEEQCSEQAREILAFAKPKGYPSIPDRGEAQHSGAPGTNAEKFADWFSQHANIH